MTNNEQNELAKSTRKFRSQTRPWNLYIKKENEKIINSAFLKGRIVRMWLKQPILYTNKNIKKNQNINTRTNASKINKCICSSKSW